MSEEVLVEDPKVTVGFERRVQLGQGNTATSSIFVQAPVRADMSAEDRMAAIKAAQFEAKVAVFDALGITYDVTVDGAAVEAFTSVLGAVEVSPADEAKAVAAASAPTTKTDNKPQSKDALWAELAENPGKWFDNRESKSKDTQPDFKRVGTGDGLWLKNRGKSVVPAGIVIPESGFHA